MESLLLVSSIVIQAIAILMVIFTFRRISLSNWLRFDALEQYRVLRNRYERLRQSLLFVAALILVQLVGIAYYLRYPDGPITLLQLLISDVIVVLLVIFLTGIYRERERIVDFHPEQKVRLARPKKRTK